MGLFSKEEKLSYMVNGREYTKSEIQCRAGRTAGSLGTSNIDDWLALFAPKLINDIASLYVGMGTVLQQNEALQKKLDIIITQNESFKKRCEDLYTENHLLKAELHQTIAR